MYDLVCPVDVCSAQLPLITSSGFIADLVREHCREQHKRNL